MMRYAIIAILIYAGYLLLRAILRNILKNSSSRSSSHDEKPKRKYDPDKVQDAEFTEIKNNGSVK